MAENNIKQSYANRDIEPRNKNYIITVSWFTQSHREQYFTLLCAIKFKKNICIIWRIEDAIHTTKT